MSLRGCARVAIFMLVAALLTASGVRGGGDGTTSSTPVANPLRILGGTELGGPPVTIASMGAFAVLDGTIDYVAGGAALRNQGYGTINLTWPGTLVRAYLVWSFMADWSPPPNGWLNDVEINGSRVASNSLNPCWSGIVHTFAADVSSFVLNGSNRLRDFPSGDTSGQDPWQTGFVLPFLEGASLIVVFDAGGPWREISLFVGADTIVNVDVTLTESFTHAAADSPSAKTTFVVADGQFPGNSAMWNGMTLDPDAFPGADPRASTAPWTDGNLWDTRTYPVVTTPGSTTDDAAISNVGTSGGDCLTWSAQVVRVDAAAPDLPPIAVARATPTVAHMGDVVTFDGSASTDDHGIVAYLWDFGDGTIASGAVTNHAYAARASFSARLTVWDTANQSDAASVTVDIVNRPPVADAGPDRSAFKNTSVVLDGRGSSDPDGDGLTFAWTQVAGPPVTLTGASTATPAFLPTASGTYTFLLAVTDGIWGGASNDTVTVSVANRPPVAEAGPDRTVLKRASVALNGSGSFDPDGDPLTFTWTQVAGPSVALAGSDTARPSFTPARIGTYAFRLRVTDGEGAFADDSVTIVVWGLPPTAVLSASPRRAFVGGAFSFDGSASSDPDGRVVAYAFDFGDGTSASGGAVTTHAYGSPGTFTVTLVVTDDDGNRSAAAQTTVVVEAVSAPPIPVRENWKPLVAAAFAAILAAAGAWSARRRPWRRGGRVSVVLAFAVVGLPFACAEVATGAVSEVTGILSIPPVLGLGTAVDLVILAAGLIVSVVRALRRAPT